MKFLYGINTQGQGHINRARYIIDELEKGGHHVDVFFSGHPPPEYVYDYFKNVVHFEMGLLLWFNMKKNRVNPIRTLIVNIPTSIGLWKFVRRFAKENKGVYDAILTDFEAGSSRIGKKLKIPTVCICHQHSISHPNIKLPKGEFMSRMVTKLMIGILVPHYTFSIGIDYIPEIDKTEKSVHHPLFMKSDFVDLQPETSDFYLIYIQSISKELLLEILTKYPDEKFVAYGYNESSTHDNVTFKETSRVGFLEDFRKCKGIISGAGFSIGWESIILKKPMYLIPQNNQYEQYLNAATIQERGLGKYSKQLTSEDLGIFLKFAEENNYVIENKIPILDVSSVTQEILAHIEEKQSSKQANKT